MTIPNKNNELPFYTNKLWERFKLKLVARLVKGQEEYGESSFTRPLPEIAEELQEELLDIAGWGFILWCRMEELKNKIKELKDA